MAEIPMVDTVRVRPFFVKPRQPKSGARIELTLEGELVSKTEHTIVLKRSDGACNAFPADQCRIRVLK
jgi:hypothetical protein